MSENKQQIIGGISWILVFVTIMFLMYHFSFGGTVLWFFVILTFFIINIYTLYRSLNYIMINEDNPSIGIIGLIVSGMVILTLIILLVVIAIAFVKSANNQ